MDLNQRVDWHGQPGTIIGLTTEPSAIVSFDDGTQITVGLSALKEAPAPALPTEPGYYVAEKPDYGGGAVVVELLNSPKGQWVDAGDRQYLTPADVAELGPLVRLELRAVTAKAVLDRVRDTSLVQFAVMANPANADEFAAIERDFGVDL